MGVIATVDDVPSGAAWLRLLVGEERESSAFVDAETPEIAVAVRSGLEGRGIGTQMLERLLALAVGVHPRVTLNVRADNPAVRVYQRLGFVTIDEIVNRVGTPSLKMVRPLDRT